MLALPMGRVVAIANQKGGVGKTTTAINLGSSLAVAEAKTLVVDMDPQANLTSGLGLRSEAALGTIYDSLIQEKPVAEIIVDTMFENLKVIPSGRNLTGAEIELVGEARREFRLKDVLSTVVPNYDYVLIDCPPSLGLLTVNALVAADSVLVPLQCEFFALEGVTELMATVERVRAGFNPGLSIAGILLTMYDERTNLSAQVSTMCGSISTGRSSRVSSPGTCASPRLPRTVSQSFCMTFAPRARKPTCLSPRRS